MVGHHRLEQIEQRVLGLLAYYKGRDNAITARFISRVVSTSERTVRQIISDLRRRGYPIGSSPNPPSGFYLPATRAEAEECSAHLWSRVRNQAEVARAFDQAAEGLGVKRTRLEQQAFVFGEGEAS